MPTDWIDPTRYWISVLFVISAPPAIAYWFAIHPFAHFWRRLGKSLAFTVLGSLFLLFSALLFLARDVLVGRDLGVHWPLVLLGLPLYLLTLAIVFERRKHLTFRILAGVPELSDDGHPGQLLREGIYGRIRHPRYLEFLLGGSAWSLILNYTGVYLMMVVTVVGIFSIIPIEEKELRERFGSEYEDYCRKVPRLIPRFRRGGVS